VSVFISEWHVLSIPLLLKSLVFFFYYENLQDISFSIEILHVQVGKVGYIVSK